MRLSLALAAAILALINLAAALAQAPAPRPHNVVLFIADGLRFRTADNSAAPTMAAITREGVPFRNGHPLFPTTLPPTHPPWPLGGSVSHIAHARREPTSHVGIARVGNKVAMASPSINYAHSMMPISHSGGSPSSHSDPSRSVLCGVSAPLDHSNTVPAPMRF
jgi:hypothetical protein